LDQLTDWWSLAREMGFLPKVTNQLPTSLQGYIPVIRAVMRLSEKVYHAYSPYFAQEL